MKQKNEVNSISTTESQNFETAMVELEALVSKIEEGNLSLEDSLLEFEKGIKLSRVCQQSLTEAEQRVKILTDDGEEPFSPGSE